MRADPSWLTDSGLVRRTESGLFCEVGGFYIDPWRPVERAVVTHAHSDHARWGMASYLCSDESEGVLRARVGHDSDIQTLAYGEVLSTDGVEVTLFPAGHILGSSQVLIERNGERIVISGDYKTEPDPTCTPFEPVRCHTFVTESTFGLPIYVWPEEQEVTDAINAWWAGNAAAGRASLVMGYALGKAQRALAGLDPGTGPIIVHGAVHRLTEEYRKQGVLLPPTQRVSDLPSGFDYSGSVIIAPPSAAGTTWLRRFGNVSTSFLSGWMAIRGARRRRAVDRGFVMSDHVDWPSLLSAIETVGAERVWVTHGYTDVVCRYLRETRGLDARPLATVWEGERDDGGEELKEEAEEAAATEDGVSKDDATSDEASGNGEEKTLPPVSEGGGAKRRRGKTATPEGKSS